MNRESGFTSWELTVVLVWLFGVLGWVLNIIWLVGMVMGGSGITAAFVLRVIGAFTPLGAVLGYIPL